MAEFHLDRTRAVKALVLVYIIIIGVRYITDLTETLLLLPVVGVGVFLIMYDPVARNKNLLLHFILWSLMFGSFAVVNAAQSQYYSVFYFAIGISSFFIGYTLFCYKEFSLRLSSSLLLVFLVFVTTKILLSNKMYYQAANDVFPGVSRNIVGAIAIYLQIFYSASYYRVRRSLPLCSMIFTSVVLFLSYGRSSILAGCFLWAIYFIFYLRTRIGALLILFLMLAAIFVGFWWQLDLTVPSFSKGVESLRIDMYREYLETTDFVYFFSGHSVLDSPTISLFSGNSHSSYIRGHSYFGIALLIFMLFLFVLIFLGVFTIGKVYVAFMAIYIFRAVFEAISFFDVFDFLLFYLLFLFVCTEREVDAAKKVNDAKGVL